MLFGTVDTWLVWKMTEGQVHVSHYTNASRTMMFNIHKLDQDERMLEVLDIPHAMLPKFARLLRCTAIPTLVAKAAPVFLSLVSPWINRWHLASYASN